MEEWDHVRHLHAQGLSIRAIAEQTGFSRNTIRGYLRVNRRPHYRARPIQPGILEPFQNYLRARFTQVPELTAWRLYVELQDQGFQGSYATVRRFLRPLRDAQSIKAVYRYETPPGLQAQVDWAFFGRFEIDGIRRPLAAFIFTLGYSRAKFVEFVTDISTPTFLACHEHAFDYLGGVPKEILYDNLKSVVLRRAFLVAQSQFNPLFVDFATYYNFVQRLCAPYRAETKGKVENTVKFVRQGFFAGTTFGSLQELNRKASLWCSAVNQRAHGTTHVAPIDRLEAEQLTPVQGRPPYPIVQSYHRRISRDCFVNFLGNRYSVPYRFAGREATLRLKGAGFVVEVAGQEICHHTLAPGTGGVIQIAEHRAGLLAAIRRQSQVRQARLESFQSMPSAPDVQRRDLAVYDTLLEGRT